MSHPTALHVQITGPSGETETLVFRRDSTTLRLGRDVAVRDALFPPEGIELQPDPQGQGLWIHVPEREPQVLLGGLRVREAFWAPGIPLVAGESRLELARPALQIPLPPATDGVPEWVTANPTGAELLRQAHRAAQSSLSIYLAGETGSGKDVLARQIHAWSDRAGNPFVPLHCGALPVGLAESELFGHMRGAFTGADRTRPGALLLAHGGTLFLDEVGDLSPEIQVKLLRFLESGEIRAVGSDNRAYSNVRVVCATHLPLKELVKEGRFRQDLYFRLASLTLRIPPLRERPEDITVLATRFARAEDRFLSPGAIEALRAHSWPGNVRELLHAIKRAIHLCAHGGPLAAGDFQFIEEDRPEPAHAAAVPLNLRSMERLLLVRALRESAGNRAKAAKLMGVARSTLFEMLKRHGIRGPKMVRVPAECLDDAPAPLREDQLMSSLVM